MSARVLDDRTVEGDSYEECIEVFITYRAAMNDTSVYVVAMHAVTENNLQGRTVQHEVTITKKTR
jgi:hypothetical protein